MTALKTLLILLAIIAALTWVRYETFAPCAMLKQDIIRAAGKESSSPAAGRLFGELFVSFDSRINSLSPGECVRDLFKLHTEGLDAVT